MDRQGRQALQPRQGHPRDATVFDYYAGVGQYPITVFDHAVGTATIANHGVRNDGHFVLKVERGNRKTGKLEHLEIGDERNNSAVAMPANVADEVTSVLRQVPAGSFALDGGGRESAGKTGSWENAINKNNNAHVWFTGYTAQIAATFWLGSKDINATPIKDTRGREHELGLPERTLVASSWTPRTRSSTCRGRSWAGLGRDPGQRRTRDGRLTDAAGSPDADPEPHPERHGDTDHLAVAEQTAVSQTGPGHVRPDPGSCGRMSVYGAW